VEEGGLSDHCPILFQLENNEEKPWIPFKFNLGWFVEEEFQELVRSNWTNYDPTLHLSTSEQFASSLNKIKKKGVL